MLTPLQESTRYKVATTAPKYKVPVPLGLAVNKIESGYGVNVGPSSAGARGPMQIMPATAAEIATEHNKLYGTNWTQQQVLDDPDTNIAGGLYYLGKHLQKTGSEQGALFRYNPSNKYVNDVLTQKANEQEVVEPSGVQQQGQQAMPTITNNQQQPFAPLQLTPVAEQLATTADTPVGSPEAAVFNTLMSGEADKAKRLRGSINQQLQLMEAGNNRDSESSIGIGPKIIATLAALSGNFGPAMQLWQLERQTSVMNAARPTLNEINNLELEGKHDEAIKLQQSLMTRVGPFAPELAKYMQTQIDRMRQDKISQLEATAQVKALDLAVPKDAPNRNQVDIMKALLSAGTPRAFAAVKGMLPHVANKLQVVPGSGLVASSELSGESKSVVLPTQFDADMLKGIPGEQLQARTGLTADQIANMLRGLPVRNAQGQLITGSENNAKLRTALAELQGERAQQQMVALAPVPPDVNAFYRARNYTPAQIAAGQISQQDHQAAYQQFGERAFYQGTGQLAAEYNAPSGVSKSGNVVFDLQTGQRMPKMSFAQADQQQGRYATIGKDQAPQAAQLIQLRNRLNTLASEISKLPDQADITGRFGNAIDRALNSRLNVSAEMKGRQALEGIVKDAVERYFNSRNIAAASYQGITTGILGPQATKESAIDALHRLDTMLSDDLRQLQNEGGTAPANAGVNVPLAPARPRVEAIPVPGSGR